MAFKSFLCKYNIQKQVGKKIPRPSACMFTMVLWCLQEVVHPSRYVRVLFLSNRAWLEPNRICFLGYRMHFLWLRVNSSLPRVNILCEMLNVPKSWVTSHDIKNSIIVFPSAYKIGTVWGPHNAGLTHCRCFSKMKTRMYITPPSGMIVKWSAYSHGHILPPRHHRGWFLLNLPNLVCLGKIFDMPKNCRRFSQPSHFVCRYLYS